MKTLIIYNSIEDDLRYFIVDGDYSRFNKVCFNSTNNHDYTDECMNWLFDENGDIKFKMSFDKSLLEDKQWDKVSIITFIP